MTGPSLMDTGTPGEVIETTPVEDPFAPPAPEPAPALEPVPEREPARVAGVFTVEEWEWFWRAADDTSRGEDARHPRAGEGARAGDRVLRRADPLDVRPGRRLGCGA